MSAVIYIGGFVTAAEELAEAQRAKIEAIENDGQAFEVKDDEISFRLKSIEGSNPVEDYVVPPLNKLLELAKEEDIRLNGSFEVTSDWSDFDNTGIDVINNRIDWYDISVRDIDTDTLKKELERRGFRFDRLEVATSAGILYADINHDVDNPGIAITLNPAGSSDIVDCSFVTVYESPKKNEPRPVDVVIRTFADVFSEDPSRPEEVLRREDIIEACGIETA